MKIGKNSSFQKTFYFLWFSIWLPISEHFGKFGGNSSTLDFEQHSVWKPDIISISDMVKKEAFLSKNWVENQISKFTARNVGFFGVFWNQMSWLITLQYRYINGSARKMKNLVILYFRLEAGLIYIRIIAWNKFKDFWNFPEINLQPPLLTAAPPWTGALCKAGPALLWPPTKYKIAPIIDN